LRSENDKGLYEVESRVCGEVMEGRERKVARLTNNEMIELQHKFIDACEEKIRIQDEIIDNQEKIIANTERLMKLERLESYKQGYRDALAYIRERLNG
jgi:hypothetical protein